MMTLIHLYNALPDALHYAAMHDLDRIRLLTPAARLLRFFGHPLYEDGSIRP